MFKYEMVFPVDWFHGCIPLTDFLKNIIEDESIGQSAAISHIEKLINALTEGMNSMPMWDGDIYEGVFVFSIPDEIACKIGFIWKQKNNGHTFVLSPVLLPHLEEFSVKIKQQQEAT